jgi:hypothetical protein
LWLVEHRPPLHLSDLDLDNGQPVHEQDVPVAVGRRPDPGAPRHLQGMSGRSALKKGEIMVQQENKPQALALEVEVIEQTCNPGCGTSTTNRHCTCPISASTTGSLFTSKTTS